MPVAVEQVHILPFQCSMTPVTPLPGWPEPEIPRAQALRPEVAVTFARNPLAGLGTSAQDAPFQRSMVPRLKTARPPWQR